jgi:hypothetical protein
VSKSIPSQNHILQNAILLLFFFFLALSLLVFLAGHGLLGGVEATDCGTCPPSVAPCLSGVATTASGAPHVEEVGSRPMPHRRPLGSPHVEEVGSRPMPRREGRVDDAPSVGQQGRQIRKVRLGRRWHVAKVAHRTVLSCVRRGKRVGWWGPPVNGKRKKMRWRREKMQITHFLSSYPNYMYYSLEIDFRPCNAFHSSNWICMLLCTLHAGLSPSLGNGSRYSFPMYRKL